MKKPLTRSKTPSRSFRKRVELHGHQRNHANNPGKLETPSCPRISFLSSPPPNCLFLSPPSFLLPLLYPILSLPNHKLFPTRSANKCTPLAAAVAIASIKIHYRQFSFDPFHLAPVTFHRTPAGLRNARPAADGDVIYTFLHGTSPSSRPPTPTIDCRAGAIFLFFFLFFVFSCAFSGGRELPGWLFL